MYSFYSCIAYTSVIPGVLYQGIVWTMVCEINPACACTAEYGQ